VAPVPGIAWATDDDRPLRSRPAEYVLAEVGQDVADDVRERAGLGQRGRLPSMRSLTFAS
jgi:hypothetical protein